MVESAEMGDGDNFTEAGFDLVKGVFSRASRDRSEIKALMSARGWVSKGIAAS